MGKTKFTNIVLRFKSELSKYETSLVREIKNLEKANEKLSASKHPDALILWKDRRKNAESKIKFLKRSISKMEREIKRETKIHEKVEKHNIKKYNKSLSVYENYRIAKYDVYKEEKKFNIFLLSEEKYRDLKKEIKYHTSENNRKIIDEKINEINKEISKFKFKGEKISNDIKERKSDLKNHTSERNKLFTKLNAIKTNIEIENEKLKYENFKLKLFLKYKDKENNKKLLDNALNKWLKVEPLYIKQLEILETSKSFYDFIYKRLKKEIDTNDEVAMSIKNLNTWYGTKQSLFDINIDFPKNKVISIIGPSGCGKSTFLRTLNRINDEVEIFKLKGNIMLGDYDVYKLRNSLTKEKMQITELRTKVGMIFQQPNPFPISISKNVSYGPRINGEKNIGYLKDLVEESLKKVALWDEVKNSLNSLGTSLSGGQQQRLCIARAVANKPEILLMDEPTSALDPIAAAKVEELILELKKTYTIIMVTHSMQQASRISDFTAFFYQGELIEYDKTKKIFTNPRHKITEDYIRGIFG